MGLCPQRATRRHNNTVTFRQTYWTASGGSQRGARRLADGWEGGLEERGGRVLQRGEVPGSGPWVGDGVGRVSVKWRMGNGNGRQSSKVATS
jgi:hypothetical protein